MTSVVPHDVDAHESDCWCVVCGTDRLAAGVAADSAQLAKYKAEQVRKRVYLVSPVNMADSIGGVVDAPLHIFATEAEAFAFAREAADRSPAGYRWHVHAFTRPAVTYVGKAFEFEFPALRDERLVARVDSLEERIAVLEGR